MKLMVASDIHGSSLYCRQLLDAFAREKADRLLLLGDILYHGPRNGLPEEYDTQAVATMLNEIKDGILCVRGNCDAEVDQMVLDFPIMAEYITVSLRDRVIYATHGHRFNMKSCLSDSDSDTGLALQPGDILLHGHTHVPAWEEFGDNNLYLNPGSVSIPKKGSERGYMIIEGSHFRWKTLDGSIYHEV